MAVRNLRLALGLFFAVVAVLLFLREAIAPGLAERLKDRNLAVGAWFALVLAGWNMARWYLDWSAPRVPAGRNPRAVRERNGEREEPNPDFDFTDATRPPGGPSPNGDQKG